MAVYQDGVLVAGSDSDAVAIRLVSKKKDGEDYTNIESKTYSDYEAYINTKYLATQLDKIDGLEVQNNSDGSITISSSIENDQTVTHEDETVPDVTNTNTGDSLLEVIKQSSTNNVSSNVAVLTAIKNQNKLLEDNNKAQFATAKAMEQLVSAITQTSVSSAQKLNDLVEQTKQSNDLKLAEIILNSDLNHAVTRISNKSQQTTVNMDTAPLVEVSESINSNIETLANGVQNQISTNKTLVDNAKAHIERLKFEKDKTITDSRGSKISPRVAQALSHAEHAFNKEAHNNFDWSKHYSDNVDELLDEDENLITDLVNLLDQLKTTSLEKIVEQDTMSIFGGQNGEV